MEDTNHTRQHGRNLLSSPLSTHPVVVLDNNNTPYGNNNNNLVVVARMR